MLLYIDAFFLGLAVLTNRGSAIGTLLGVVGTAAYIYGAYGIANEQKRGYQVAVIASFLPLFRRVVIVLLTPEAAIGSKLSFILIAGNVLNVIFEYALIGLLLHPMSKNHQKVWFS